MKKFLLVQHFFVFITSLSIISCKQESPIGITYIDDINFHNRTFIVTVPSNYDSSNPSPLLFAFHGAGMDGEFLKSRTKFDSLTLDQRYIVVYPNSIYGAWTDGCDCNISDQKRVDDLAFVDFLIDSMKKAYTIDTTRIYGWGVSQGATFLQRLACDRAEKFAAFSSYLGTLRLFAANSCNPNSSVNMQIVNSTDDPDVLWNGLVLQPYSFISVPEVVKKWSGINGCSDSADVIYYEDKVDYIEIEKHIYSDCTSAKEVELIKIINGGHYFYRNAEFDYSAEAINFFNKHRLNE